MGRNSGSQIFFNHYHPVGDQHYFTWYCQQHGTYEVLAFSGTLATAFTNLKIEIETTHGCAEQ